MDSAGAEAEVAPRGTATARKASSLVIRPAGPVPATRATSTPASARTRRAAGMTVAGASGGGLAEAGAAGSWAGAAGLGAGPGEAAPDSKIPMTSPTLAVSPRFFRTREMMPSAGAGSSTVAFSDSMRTTGSSFRTGCPSGFSHSPSWTSVMDSPTGGTRNSSAIYVRGQGFRSVPGTASVGLTADGFRG